MAVASPAIPTTRQNDTQTGSPDDVRCNGLASPPNNEPRPARGTTTPRVSGARCGNELWDCSDSSGPQNGYPSCGRALVTFQAGAHVGAHPDTCDCRHREAVPCRDKRRRTAIANFPGRLPALPSAAATCRHVPDVAPARYYGVSRGTSRQHHRWGNDSSSLGSGSSFCCSSRLSGRSTARAQPGTTSPAATSLAAGSITPCAWTTPRCTAM